MKTSFLAALALLIAGTGFAADSDKVSDAITKLNAANYSWTTTVKMPGMPFEPGPLKGQTEKSGLAMITQEINDFKLEAIFKGDKVALKTDGEWKLPDESDGRSTMMTGWLTRTGTPGKEAGDLLKKAKELKAGDDAISADFTEAGAKELLTFGPRGGSAPGPKDAKGSVKFWLKDGVLVKFESHLQGKIAFGPDQEARDFDVTRTTELREVGTTRLDVPAEAKKLLEGK